MAAFDLFGAERARDELAESAGFAVELLRRTAKASAPDALAALYRIGACGDAVAARRFSALYLKTAEGRPGEIAARGFATPDRDDPWWPLANALASFHARKPLGAAMDILRTHPAPRGFARGSEWWHAMVSLAVHCLTARKPSPSPQLGTVAALNQKVFVRGASQMFYEAWFAEQTMAFAAAAVARGWQPPERDPHPSMPLALLRLPKRHVPSGAWGDLPSLAPDLKKGIERSAR